MDRREISEEKFESLCSDIHRDREIIFKHNPIGTEEETLLWMLMSVLISYLSINESETPCFNGKPNADTYRDAIIFVLKDKKQSEFDEIVYLSQLSEARQ